MKNSNIEDKFFGKRIVKTIFAKAQFAHKNLSALIAKAKQLGIEAAKRGYGSPSTGDPKWMQLHSELLAGATGGAQYSPDIIQAEKEMLNAFMEANKKERSRLGFSQTGGKTKFAESPWGRFQEKEVIAYTNESEVLMAKINSKIKELENFRRELESATQQLSLSASQENRSLLEKSKGRISQCDKARQSFSRTGIKSKFADMGSMDKEGRATWSRLESQIKNFAEKLNEYSKDGNFKDAGYACEGLKNMYEKLGALFTKASKNVSPKSSPYFSKKKFGKEPLDYGDFTTKGGQTYTLGYTENWDGTYTAYLHSGMDRVNRMRVCKTWEEFQFWAKEIARKHNAVSQEVFARTGGKSKFEITKRYGLPEFTKQKILDMIKTGKYEAIYDVKEGVVELRNNVTKKTVQVYCSG